MKNDLVKPCDPRQFPPTIPSQEYATTGGEVPAPRIAIAIPCYNEEVTVAKVVRDFAEGCPHAEIHVFDNGSTDLTVQNALGAGAIVHRVLARGKGHVVRAIFRQLECDALVIVDGDDTYSAKDVNQLIEPVLAGAADMVVATRLEQHGENSFRPFHMMGNKLFNLAINTLFRVTLRDVLSGYRAFSPRFAKTCPILSHGFEVETELTLRAIEHSFPIYEIPAPYRERPRGSLSKLRTVRDGVRVLLAIFRIFRDFRPLLLFGALGVGALFAGAILGLLVIDEFQQLHRVIGISRAMLAVGLCLFGGISLTAGITLDSINRRIHALYVLIADEVILRK